MSFTYIIPFKYSNDRYKTLLKVLENIKSLDCQKIIVEQGSEPKLKDFPEIIENVEYIFIENNLPFNKSWALNCGWKKSVYDIIVFGDADNIIDTNNLLDAVNLMSDYDFISPHNKLIDLTQDESEKDISTILSIDRYGRGETDHQKLPMCGAMTIFNKNSLEKISGWPEEFFGWGAEDDAMTIKVKKFLKWKELDRNCYHLYHERVIPEEQWYYRNISIYNNYFNADENQLMNYLNSIRPIIGNEKRIFTQ